MRRPLLAHALVCAIVVSVGCREGPLHYSPGGLGLLVHSEVTQLKILKISQVILCILRIKSVLGSVFSLGFCFYASYGCHNISVNEPEGYKRVGRPFIS